MINQQNFEYDTPKETNPEQVEPLNTPEINNELFDDNSSDCKSEGDPNSYSTGRWNQNEHYRFIKGCILFGNNWKKVKYKFRMINLI